MFLQCDGHCRSLTTPQTDQKSGVLAVDVTKTGTGGQSTAPHRAVEVAELGDPHRFRAIGASRSREAKEVGQYTEAIPDITMERLDS